MSNSEWGAIRRSLADSVSNVIEKKMETSSGYKPSEWAEQINLMGPLPEKTASGAIASFNDGADDVPVKEAKFYFLPKQASGTPTPSSPISIDGWTGLTAYRQKKNLLGFDVEWLSTVPSTFDSTKAVYLKSGTQYTISCASVLNATTWRWCFKLFDGSGNAIYSGSDISSSLLTANSSAQYYVEGTNRSTTSLTFTANVDGYAMIFIRLGNGDATSKAVNPQLEIGSSASTYEAYSTPTTYPVSWSEHGTIYGGYVDATRGKVVKTYATITFNGLETWSAYSGGNGYSRAISDMKSGTWYTDNGSRCDIFEKQPNNTNLGVRIGVNNDGIYVVQANTIEGVSDATSFRSWLSNHNMTISYPLATPVEYDITAFTPNTLYGTNNFFSDANGDAEITYRADINLALSASATRSAPVIQEESEER